MRSALLSRLARAAMPHVLLASLLSTLCMAGCIESASFQAGGDGAASDADASPADARLEVVGGDARSDGTGSDTPVSDVLRDTKDAFVRDTGIPDAEDSGGGVGDAGDGRSDVGPDTDASSLPFPCQSDTECAVALGEPPNPCLVAACHPQARNCFWRSLPNGSAVSIDEPCALATRCELGQPRTTVRRECDDGNSCTDDVCEPGVGCTYTALTGGPCDDANACSSDGTCLAGTCVATTNTCPCVEAADCTPFNDDNPCNGRLTCDAGICVVAPETVVHCPPPDEPGCTRLTCRKETGVCELAPLPDGSACEDGDSCTAVDACQAGVCSPGPALDCDDGNACSEESCDPALGCAWTALEDGACDDGDPCTAGDGCVEGLCQGERRAICACDGDADCAVHDDEDRCNGVLRCTDGFCAVDRRAVVVCADAAADCGGLDCACARTLCDSATGDCAFEPLPDGLFCGDDDACTLAEACAEGQCEPGATLPCDDRNPCTADRCDAALGCVHEPTDGACDDGTPCTGSDECVAGACTGEPYGCPGREPCIEEHCLGDGACSPPILLAGYCDIDGVGCVETGAPNPDDPCERCDPDTAPRAWSATPDGAACDDEDACTEEDACAGGVCSGAALDCDDADACTTDGCDSGSGCTHDAIECADDLECTTDGCDAATGCTHALDDAACDDENPCTQDLCSVSDGCLHDGGPLEGEPCDAGNACTTGTSCSAGACQGGTPVPVDDGNSCTTDACDAGTGLSHEPRTGEACTADDPCAVDPRCAVVDGTPTCTWGVLDCEDGNGCTEDVCDPAAPDGCRHDPTTADCEDGDPCTVGDTCFGGDCHPGEGPLDCDDSVGCTQDACEPGFGCQNVPDDAACDDSDLCTTNTCDPVAGCVFPEAPDGTPCGGNHECVAGECVWTGFCGETECPALPGYSAACNAQAHCEYASEDPTGWRAWDVWIWVPPGSFEMGRPETELGNADETPQHTVTFARGFFIAKYETTVAMHEACEVAGRCEAPSTGGWDGEGWGLNRAPDRAGHPQNGLTWAGAKTYCTWNGGRLASEAEWEYAASGPVHRVYPWGDAPAPSCEGAVAVFSENGQGVRPWGCVPCTASGCSGTDTVGLRPGGASYAGALDMAGNVLEWVEDGYHADYRGAPSDGSAMVLPAVSLRVTRGGGFNGSVNELRAAYRGEAPPETEYANAGVRCVRDISPIGVYCNTACPALPGFDATCNAQNHCEYARAERTEPWYAWDVWIWVPPGSFPMGSLPDEGAADEFPQHTVTFADGYFIHKVEETAAALAAFLNDRGSNDCAYAGKRGQCVALPVTGRNVDWDGATATIRRDCQAESLDPADQDCAEHPATVVTYQGSGELCLWEGGRLCTEAEWERAAKGSTDRLYPWGSAAPDTSLANGGDAGFSRAAPVGHFPLGASPVGAFDLAGNLWEWVEDDVHGSYTDAPVDGSAWIEDPRTSGHVRRGGSYLGVYRASGRDFLNTVGSYPNQGVRCCRAAPCAHGEHVEPATAACAIPGAACAGHADGVLCHDGDACTDGDSCHGGVCVAGPPTDCNDGDSCTVDSCDGNSGCTHGELPVELFTDETCNGEDDDCDGLTDADDADDLLANDLQPCDEQLGVCAGASKPAAACMDGVWTACVAADYPEGYEEGAETLLDGQDNDCDGATDEDFDLDHDGVCAASTCAVREVDTCPTAWNPDNDPTRCASLGEGWPHARDIALTEAGESSTWRRTNEPVEIPLVNGILDDSVAGYWPLDGGDARDASGRSNDGTVQGAVAAASTFGDAAGSLRFDGSATVEVPDLGVEDGPLSILAWLRLSHGGTPQMLLSKWGDSCGVSFILQTSPDDSLSLVVASESGGSLYTNTATTIPLDRWVHVAAVFAGSGAQIYIDGSMAETSQPVLGGTWGGAAPRPSTCRTLLGGIDDNAGSGRLQGNLDDVVVLRRAVAANEIAAYCRSGRPYGTTFVPGAQADFDDVRVAAVDEGVAPAVLPAEILGPRPHSDSPCPMDADDGTWADRDDLCGVLGYWPLDGDGRDRSGAGRDGAVSGAVPGAGRFGEAAGGLTFDGRDDWMDTADTADLVLAEGTVEAWIEPFQCVDSEFGTVIDKNETGPFNDIMINIDQQCGLHCQHGLSTDVLIDVQSPDVIPVGRWTHVSCTWDGSELRLFVDGFPVAHAADVFPVEGAAAPVRIGCNGPPRQWCFPGAIDEVLLHSVAKTQEYLHRRANPGVPTMRFPGRTQLFPDVDGRYPYAPYRLHWGNADAIRLPVILAGSGGVQRCVGLLSPCAGYAGWWRFNGGSGTVAVDSSTGKRNGTLEGADGPPTWVAGAEGTALAFDGGDDRVDVPGVPEVPDGSPFSLEVAVAPAGSCPYSGDRARIVERQGTDGGYSVGLRCSGAAGVAAVESNGWSWVEGAVLAAGENATLAAVFDGASLSLYVAGAASAPMTLGEPDSSSATDLRIGAQAGPPGLFFAGSIDSVRLMTRALAPDEQLHYPLASWALGPLLGPEGAPLDTDGDGVLDDGDGSGIPGDTPCEPDVTTDCDDNCPEVANPDQVSVVGQECGTHCGGARCPALPGHSMACNPQEHCEYTYAGEDTAEWRRWDVWIWVPPGRFLMGAPEGEPGSEPDERPLHEVTFAEGYFIAKYEVVVEQHETCEASGTCTPPSTADWDGLGWGTNRSSNGRGAHPQNGLTWAQAGVACAWLGGRQPSEAEWEYAATGPLHRRYPWGDTPTPTCANGTAVFNEPGDEAGYGCSAGGTLPVGSAPAGASWCGALDMAGNLFEWVEDVSHPDYDGAPADGGAWVGPAGWHHVERGGAFYLDASHLRSAYRRSHPPTNRDANSGVRCARDLPCGPGETSTPDGCSVPGADCVGHADGVYCDDGGACTDGDTCQAGVCVAGSPTDCDDGVDCTTDSCDGTAGCQHASDDDACDDGNPCTDDICHAPLGCLNVPVEHGTACGADLACVAGECSWLGTCAGIECPDLLGYAVACNGQAHCEYSYAGDDTALWRAWDVWIWVPPGSFEMGRPDGESGAAGSLPQHAVTFAEGFFIAKYEVTVLQYEACEIASPETCTPPSTLDWGGDGWGVNRSSNGRSAHPQNGLTWEQAGAVCVWLGGRRPAEAEWEYAAKGPVHRLYPWGDGPEPTCSNGTAVYNEAGGTVGYGCGQGGSAPAGSRPAGTAWCGALDMSGNLFEWLDDYYHPDYEGAPTDGSAWVWPTDGNRAMRGGAFQTGATYLRSAARDGAPPADRYASNGARCVLRDSDRDGWHDALDSDDDNDGDQDTSDCSPLDSSISHLAVELCNGVDDDCDGNTDFRWMLPGGNQMPWTNWNSAMAYCEGLSLDGLQWRLPTIEEMAQCIFSGGGGCKCSVPGWNPQWGPTCYHFWSSSEASAVHAWSMFCGSGGGPSATETEKANSLYAMCVSP